MININNIKNLNIEYIESLLTSLASDALSGDIVQIDKTVSIQLPKQMMDIVAHVVANSDYTENDVLSKMCSISLKQNVEELLKDKKEVIPQTNPFDVLSKSSEFADLGAKIKDMENITNQFESMKQGIEALTKLAEAIEKKK